MDKQIKEMTAEETADETNRIKAMNLYQKLSEITREIGWVAKNSTVRTTNGSFKATQEADILAAIIPVEARYRVYSYPLNREILDQREFQNKNGVNFFYEKIQTTYRFVNIDKPDEFIDITSYGIGLDAGDKADGKAMTYSDKYALMKAYKIRTGEDPDSEDAPHDLEKTEQPKRTKPTATDNQLSMIAHLYSMDEIKRMVSNLGLKDETELSIEQASQMIAARKGK